MKILLLANCNSIHTQRWAFSLAQKGINICLFSLEKSKDSVYSNHENIKLIEGSYINSVSNEGGISKLKLLTHLPLVWKTIRQFKPDIVHAHYATSYGLLGALCGFQPFVLSVWGSDIFEFPKISKLHRWLVKFNLSQANTILSTSNIMAKETQKHTHKEVLVTPFGINLQKFEKHENGKRLFSSESIVVGTVKTLLPKYGIEFLIHAFKLVKDKHPRLPLKLLIVGDGRDKEKLINLSEKLGIINDVRFTGFIGHENIPMYVNELDIYVALSTCESESFGVAIIEASACELPVVVSNVGGLPEVVENNKTGFVVEAKNSMVAALAIEQLVINPQLRKDMGKMGRQRVLENYNWENNVDNMIEIYIKIYSKWTNQ